MAGGAPPGLTGRPTTTDRPGCGSYSTRRMGLPRMAADHVVVSLTPDGKAARTWIQHPVPTLLSHV